MGRGWRRRWRRGAEAFQVVRGAGEGAGGLHAEFVVGGDVGDFDFAIADIAAVRGLAGEHVVEGAAGEVG